MEQYEREHLGALRRIAPECMVLLKSNGDFPLAAPQKIALYGNGARHTLKGGRGSGDVNVEYFPSLDVSSPQRRGLMRMKQLTKRAKILFKHG